MNVHIKEVNPGDVADEFTLEHVKVTIQVDKDGVKQKRLVRLQAVDGFATADGEGRVLDFTGVSWKTRMALTAFRARGTFGARGAFESTFTWCSSITTVSFVACTQ